MDGQFETANPGRVAGLREDTDTVEPDLETVMHLIWDRLEALQEQRRRSQHHAAVFATVALAALVLWAGFPTRTPAPEPLVVRDARGNVRARFDVDPASGRTTFQLVDVKGKPQAVLGADVAGPTLTFYDREGTARMRVALEHDTEAPIVDVVDRATGAASRVNLVDLRNSHPELLPPPQKPPVRRGTARAPRTRSSETTAAAAAPSRAPRQSSYAVCLPGTLGCSRYPSGG
jgi:hypothetical protein